MPAELVDHDPTRPKVVKVIYQHSRTAAWIDRNRIIDPPWLPNTDTKVFIASRRKGTEAHRTHPERIHRWQGGVLHGDLIPAAEAINTYQATWCTTCWPWPTQAKEPAA